MTITVLLITWTSVLVNMTLHPASQNRPMLSRLFVKELIMWQSSVPDGKCGSRSLACPIAVMVSPLAMFTVVGGSLEVKVVVGALPWK